MSCGADTPKWVGKCPSCGDWNTLAEEIDTPSSAPLVAPSAPVAITTVGTLPNVLVAHPSVPARNLAELVALAKKEPGKLSYASFGAGTSAHLAGAMLEAQAGVEMIHVPYKGQAPALNDVIGGQVTVMFGNWPEFRQHVQSGKLVALGMATAKRSPLAPQIATLAEQGMPIESNSWNGMLTRAGTPDAVVQRLNSEINKSLQAPAVLQAFQEGGITSLAGTPDRFAVFIRSETDKYAQVIRKAGITAES
jgi:tripartite-type tricarboxylate transporter receptor subunit TctC